MIGKVKDFVTVGIWRIRVRNLSRPRSVLINGLRIVLLALRGFAEDKCQLRASALTFYTLLSLVPVMAMAFGIAKGFGLEKMLERQIMEKSQGQEEVAVRVITFARSLLENTRGGLLAGIGVAVLFWTVIKVLSNIESSFNDIWGIKTPRSWIRKFSDYLSIMLVCPVLFILASSLTVFIRSQVEMITAKVALLGAISPYIYGSLRLLPYAVLWLLFCFIYVVMPNTRVQIRSGLFAGVVAGTLYQVVQWAYIFFQVGVAKYGAVYGSFAALPLLLVWLQISWLVVLFGAEISFAHQNVETYEFEPDCLQASPSLKRLLSLRVVHFILEDFTRGKPPLSAARMSHLLEIPIRLLNQILFDLVKAGILSEVRMDDSPDTGFQPARDPEGLTVQSVLEALDARGTTALPVRDSPELQKLAELLSQFAEGVKASPANRRLRDL